MIQTKIFAGLALAVVMASVIRPVFGANDLQYDVQDQRNAATFKQLIWKTRSCMNEGARAMLVQGARDSSTITTFVQNTCGGPLASFMTQTLQRPNAEVTAFIQAMAYDELNRIPGLTRSAGSPNSAKQIEWGKPAMLTGTLGTAMFDNCCVGGKETKQRYFFIRLDRKVDIISQFNDETEPTMKGVEIVQLGVKPADLGNLKEGQAITVSCKDLWYGNTGHYALPAYCTEAKVKN